MKKVWNREKSTKASPSSSIKEDGKNMWRKWWLEIIFITLFGVIAVLSFTETTEKVASLKTEKFEQYINEGKVDYITYQRGLSTIEVTLTNGKTYSTVNLDYDGYIKDLIGMGVDDIRTQQASKKGVTAGLISLALTFVMAYVLIKWVLSSLSTFTAKDGGNELETKNVVTFDAVAGMTEEKEEIRSAIMSLSSMDQLKGMGFKPVKGILLEGPPGVGKTLLAKAIAGEAGVNFLSYSGAGFDEMFVGVGSLRVRQMFKKAEAMKPCVVFIDEIDSVGSRRSNDSSTSKETGKTLTTLLEKMDGISSTEGVLFIGATNRVSELDSALIRPGRFDKIIHIGAPKTKKDREAIVAVHMKGKQFEDGVDAEAVSKHCYGLTGAEIAAVLNDAVMESYRDSKEGVVSISHVDAAAMKLLTKGVAKGAHVGEDLFRAAVHEMGHALMNEHLDRKVIKISVQPYSGGVGGICMVDGESRGSNSLRSKEDWINDIKVLYAGMAAEEVILGSYSNGNSNDLEQATGILHHMVSAWGMGDGSLLSGEYFRKSGALPIMSELTMKKMDKIGAEIYATVRAYLSQEEVKERLRALAKELEQKEILYGVPVDVASDISAIMEG